MLKIGNYYTINAMGDLRIVKLDGKTKGKRGNDLRWWYYGRDKDGNIIAGTQKEWRKFNPLTHELKAGDWCEVVGNGPSMFKGHTYHAFNMGTRVVVIEDDGENIPWMKACDGRRQYVKREWLKLLPGC